MPARNASRTSSLMNDITPNPDGASAQPPLEKAPAELASPSSAAGGLKAVGQTVRFAVGLMGVKRGVTSLLKVNQKNGFDCQSCAWPSPDGDRHVAEFCENGAKALADEGTRKRVARDFFARHSVSELASQSDHWLNAQGRLVGPMILRAGAAHYEPIAWDDAFALLARELHALASPREALFYTSGRTSNEAAFLYQLFARQFGTNNLPDCSNMCHESSGAAMSAAIGVGKGTVKLEDFDKADAIFIVGQNPGTNHPRMLSSLQKAKRSGCTIVTINPLAEVGSRRFINPQEFKNPFTAIPALLGIGGDLSDLHLPVRINGDLACFRGLIKEMLEAEDRRRGSVLDRDFIQEFCSGFEDFADNVLATEWPAILETSGLSREQIREAAGIAMRSKRTICCWAMGLTQHENAVDTIREVLNFLLLRGNIGRHGAGACPVRGHSNVQGDRTMGVSEKMSDAFLDRLGQEFEFEPPRWHGFDTVNSIKAMAEGRARFFFAMGGNFLSATPDTEFTARALRNCRLTAHVSTKLNRSHLVTGEIALILPCLGRSEIDTQAGGAQFVTVEDSMGIINSSRGHLWPASEHLLSEPAIVAGLAQATLGDSSKVPWAELSADYDRIRDRIERVIPGFENFNERIRSDVFHLPNPARDRREFRTATGRAAFHTSALSAPSATTGGRFVMMTIRSHDQFNTTIYGLDDRYRGVFNGRRVIFMNAGDMADCGLVQSQFVDLVNRHGGRERRARHFQVAPYDIPRGCTATYFPEANALVPIDTVARISNTPASKSVRIDIEASADPEEGLRLLSAE